MASAVAPSFYATNETTNYARLCRLLVDVSRHVLRETFEKKRPPGNLDSVLSTPQVHGLLQSLKRKRELSPSQWGKLYPSIKSPVSSQYFDINLLIVLLKNICGLVPPSTGWDTLPPAADTTLEADIARIKIYRETVYGYAGEASFDDTTFNQYWKGIQDALVRLGGAGYQSVIDDLKNECTDPAFKEYHRELLKQWVKEEVSIKERLNEMKVKFEKRFDDLEVKMVDLERRNETGSKSEYSIIFNKHIFKILKCIHVSNAFLNWDCFCVQRPMVPSIRSSDQDHNWWGCLHHNSLFIV